jgi:WD40 repeat protein
MSSTAPSYPAHAPHSSGPVNDLAIHPSGKFFLSAGRDRSLRIWDAMKGRCAYITKRPRGIAWLFVVLQHAC